RFDMQAIGPAILLVRFADQEPGLLHSLKQRGDRVGIAAHQLSQFALGDAIVLEESAHDRELVWSDFKLRGAAAKGLVEAVPGAAEQGGQALAFGRIDRQRRIGWPSFGASLARGEHCATSNHFRARRQARADVAAEVTWRVLLADRGSPSRSGTNFRARFGPILTSRQSETLRLGE